MKFRLAILLFPAVFSANLAFGWGLHNDLNHPVWSKAALIFPVLKTQSVKYCVEISNPRFRSESLLPQVDSALRVWLSALMQAGFPQVSLAQVGCDSPDKNLKIVLGPESVYPDFGAYQMVQVAGDEAYSLVKIDSEYIYKASDPAVAITDIFDLMGAPADSFSAFLDAISFSAPKTVKELALEKGLRLPALFWSTYRILIHEFGHSFGLCDTYAAQIEQQCDPAFRSAEQPTSVMKDSMYFYLTDDDRAGVAALFARFGSTGR